MKIELRNYSEFDDGESFLSFNIKAEELSCAMLANYITYDDTTYKIKFSEMVIPKYPKSNPNTFMILSVENL